METIGDVSLVYETTIKIVSDDGESIANIINYRHYNSNETRKGDVNNEKRE